MHDQRVACLVAAVVQAGKALGFRRAGHVQRALDGAGRAIFNAQFLVLGVHAHVQETVQAQAGGEQTGFATSAQGVQVRNTGPVFVRCDVQIVNGFEQVGQQAVHDLFGAWVAATLVQAAGQTQEVLDFRGVENLDGHGEISWGSL